MKLKFVLNKFLVFSIENNANFNQFERFITVSLEIVERILQTQ